MLEAQLKAIEREVDLDNDEVTKQQSEFLANLLSNMTPTQRESFLKNSTVMEQVTKLCVVLGC